MIPFGFGLCLPSSILLIGLNEQLEKERERERKVEKGRKGRIKVSECVRKKDEPKQPEKGNKLY